MFRLVSAIALTAALPSATAFAAESGGAGYSIGITGHVPVICRASLDASVVPTADGETRLGSLNEYCNSPNGYQIFVERSPELADATLIIDGKPVALSGDGPTLVASSDSPNILSRSVSLDSPDGGGGSLSFRIVAR